MVVFTQQLVALTAVFAVVLSLPFPNSTPNPAYIAKRSLYNLDDIKNDDQKAKLTQGLKDAVAIAAKAMDKMDDDKHKDKLEFWFGKEHSDDDARKAIKNVFKNFAGDDGHEDGSDDTGKVKVYAEDYYKIKGKEFCSIVTKDGKTGTAYYKTKGTIIKEPGMHFCDKVFERADLATLKSDGCKALGDRVSTTAWTKNFVGANVLHEYMHYDKVGEDAVGKQVGDSAYGAWNCHQLAANDDDDERKKTLFNADTYVYYALHIAMEEICGKEFKEADSSDS